MSKLETRLNPNTNKALEEFNDIINEVLDENIERIIQIAGSKAEALIALISCFSRMLAISGNQLGLSGEDLAILLKIHVLSDLKRRKVMDDD